MKKILGQKLKMSQIYKNDKVVPVTPIKITGGDVNGVKEGDLVNISGISKGKGFQGVVKRHSFSGGPKTHGQKNRLRAPGSIGNTSPQRVIPGRRMPGHMGVKKITVRNLEIISLDNDKKLILVKGAVPGNEGGKIELCISR